MSISQIDPRERTWDAVFGETVHLHLRRRGVNQKVLGAYMGLTQSTISNKLRGGRAWFLHDIVKVADFLQVEIPTLLEEVERARRDSNPKPSDP